MHEFRPVLW